MMSLFCFWITPLELLLLLGINSSLSFLCLILNNLIYTEGKKQVHLFSCIVRTKFESWISSKLISLTVSFWIHWFSHWFIRFGWWCYCGIRISKKLGKYNCCQIVRHLHISKFYNFKFLVCLHLVLRYQNFPRIITLICPTLTHQSLL